MNQQIAVIGQDPLTLVISFKTDREFSRILFQAEADFVGNGLNLPLIRAGTDDKDISKGSYASQVENLDVDGFFGFGRANREQPGWGSNFKAG